VAKELSNIFIVIIIVVIIIIKNEGI